MNADAVHSAGPTSPAWLRNVRLALGVGIVWGVLYLLLSPTVLPAGLSRPAVVLGSHAPLLAGPTLLVGLWTSTAIGALVAGRSDPTGALLVASLGLLAWLAPGGTMDDWLIANCPVPAPPTAGPYLRLLGDYALGIVALGGAVTIGALLAGKGGFSKALRLKDLRGEVPAGLASLVAASVVALAVMWPLMGPAVSHTRRGQVAFAVIVGCTAGVAAARSLLGDRHALWMWLVPAVVGLTGVLAAAASPSLALYGPYAQNNVIPAWWAVRALPLEMLALGTAATIWAQPLGRASAALAP